MNSGSNIVAEMIRSGVDPKISQGFRPYSLEIDPNVWFSNKTSHTANPKRAKKSQRQPLLGRVVGEQCSSPYNMGTQKNGQYFTETFNPIRQSGLPKDRNGMTDFEMECMVPKLKHNQDILACKKAIQKTDLFIEQQALQQIWNQQRRHDKQEKKRSLSPSAAEKQIPSHTRVERQKELYSRVEQEEKQSLHYSTVDHPAQKKLSFQQRLEQLRRYKDKYGHLNVSGYCKNGPSAEFPGLGPWVNQIRFKYKRFKEGMHTPHTSTDQERFEILEEMGFMWSPNFTWHEMYDRLKLHYKKYGNIDIPTRHENGKYSRLGNWLVRQRQRYRLRQENKKSPITIEQIELLNALQADWHTCRRRKRSELYNFDKESMIPTRKDLIHAKITQKETVMKVPSVIEISANETEDYETEDYNPNDDNTNVINTTSINYKGSFSSRGDIVENGQIITNESADENTSDPRIPSEVIIILEKPASVYDTDTDDDASLVI